MDAGRRYESRWDNTLVSSARQPTTNNYLVEQYISTRGNTMPKKNTTKVTKKPIAKKPVKKVPASGNLSITNTKYSTPVNVASEYGNRIINAMALYTNATVTLREKDKIALSIPLTVQMGKQTDLFRWIVNFGPEEFGVAPKVVEDSVTDLEIGKQMFAMLCDYLSHSIVDKKGRIMHSVKNNSITTQYGDKYIWKGTEGIVVEAGAKK